MSDGPSLWLIAPLALLLGAIVGSFLATLMIRWPRDEGIVGGRSRCDHCGARLTARELVPILSFARQKGLCRSCGAAIDRRHVTVELASAGVALIAVLAHPLPLAIATSLLGWWLLVIAALDLEHHWLPNRLTLPLIPAGLAVAWLGLGPSLEERAIGAAAGFIVLAAIALLYRRIRGREGMGGADPGAGLLGLVAVALMALRGEAVTSTSKLPLGTLMAVAAWPVWLVVALCYSC